MFTQKHNCGLAKLANDQICTWRGNIKPITPSAHEHTFAMLVVCSTTDILVGLTHDGSVLAGRPCDDALVDITAMIYKALGIDNCAIEEIHAYGDYIIVRAGRYVGNIQIYAKFEDRWIQSGFALANIAVYKLEYDIDLISFNESHGFIRTVDGTLYSTGSNSYCEGGVPFEGNFGRGLCKVDIPYAQDISKIICGNSFTVLLMMDGSVRACGSGHGDFERGYGDIEQRYAHIPFKPVEFSGDVCVAKVITDGYLVFYVTIKGLCYVADTTNRWRPLEPTRHILGQDAFRAQNEKLNPILRGLRPILMHTLKGYSIENVFLLKNTIIVQHDGGKLAWIRDSNKEPIPLPFFDDEFIVSVNWSDEHIYFITIKGHMYNSGTDINQDQIVMIPFFTDNPIMVEHSTNHIRSAASDLSRGANY